VDEIYNDQAAIVDRIQFPHRLHFTSQVTPV